MNGPLTSEAPGTRPGRRSPDDVEVSFVSATEGLRGLANALRSATAVAVDTETVYTADFSSGGLPGALRVVSVAARQPDGEEQAWVVDVRDVPPVALAPVLDGVEAAGWNANFDAGVLDAACFGPAGLDRTHGVRWWDAQFADALLYSGMSGFGWFHGLAWAVERYLGFAAVGKGTTQLSYDATSDLTAAQIRYAADDAIETLWVADVLRAKLASHGLQTAAELEMAARPFLDWMQRCGISLDRSGYARHLDGHRKALERCLTTLAELTGGGQGNLLDPALKPSWNPASEGQAKEALNRWSEGEVRAYLGGRGAGRLLTEHDRLDGTALGDIGGPVATSLLEHRRHAKVLSAYGDNLTDFVGPDDRFHPRYIQVVGVNTGRLSSRDPNVLAFPPGLQAFLRPGDPDAVFVHADVSQAELRWLAQVSNDAVLAAELSAGDVHAATAERLFDQEMAALASTDKACYDALRARAKAINFGIVYGQRASALAASLSRGGSATTVSEAQQFLDAYLESHPGVTKWVREQDRVVTVLADCPPSVDWQATLRLYDDLIAVRAFRRDYRDVHGRWPAMREVQDAHPDVEDNSLVFDEPVVLTTEHEPVEWSSRTLSGRRRRFTIATSSILRRVCLAASATITTGPVSEVWQQVARSRGIAAYADGCAHPEPVRERMFEDRPLRRHLVDQLHLRAGANKTEMLLNQALSAQIRLMVNAHRNAPIQGGVADAMSAAYGELWQRIAPRPNWYPVLTVHDSIVIECPRSEMAEAAKALGEAIEAGFSRFCPDVGVAYELDARSSLADTDVIHRFN